MAGSQDMLLHVPFFEALAAADESAPEWQPTSAGLVTLRLFDAWIAEGPRAVAADVWGLSAVRQAIAKIDPRCSLRALLTGIVDAMETAPRAKLATAAPRMLAYARALRFEARWSLAADIYRTVLAHASPVDDPDLVVTANLQLALCLRMLTEWTEAAAALATAGRVAALSGDIMSVLRARIAEANLAIDVGNLPHAGAILDQAMRNAAAHGFREIESQAMHDRATVALRSGDCERAVTLLHTALDGAREPVHRDRVMADLAAAFAELGLRSAARDALLVLAATAQEQYARWAATINLMEIAALDGSEPLFEQHRRELMDTALPASLAAHYHLYVGQGYRLFHRFTHARSSLERAIEIASSHRLNQVLFRAEETLQEIRDGGVIIIARAPTAPSPEVGEVANAVREMRELAGVG